jgi:hypothetical protein
LRANYVEYINENSGPKKENIMTTNVEFYTEDEWSEIASRSILYYAYLLTLGRREESYRDLLEEMSTPQGQDFRFIIDRLTRSGIFDDENTCHFTPEGFNAVKNLVNRDLGKDKNFTYNGLDIFESEKNRRYEKWAKKGCDSLEKLFGQIPHMIIDRDKQGYNKGEYITFQYDLNTPVMIIWFSTIPRFSDTNATAELDKKVLSIVYERQRLAQSGKVDFYGTQVISIVAAIAYERSVANVSVQEHRHLLGPINLEIIENYFSANKHYLAQGYLDMLAYLAPSGPAGGVIDGLKITDFIEYRRKLS